MDNLRYRFDAGFDLQAWLQLYHESDYNRTWSLANAKVMAGHAYMVITAWQGARAVGSLTVLSDGMNYAQIEDVVVHPDFRGQGLGTTLVRFALDRLRTLPSGVITLHAIPGAAGFYEKLGFKALTGTPMYFRL